MNGFERGKWVLGITSEKYSAAAGQYPAAVILGCVDSQLPAEIIFDAGIGDTFSRSCSYLSE
jgi:carbonic anhydrase